ncbi:MAG: hypothetical protein ABI397_00950, partial [Candidatus Saccharimonas sp.]
MIGLIVFFVVAVAVFGAAGALLGLLTDSIRVRSTVIAISVVIAIGLTGANYLTVYKNDHWATCHVTDKDRGGDSGSYRVYTNDCGQLSVQDSVLRDKYNSADIWQKIPKEGTIQVRVVGVRIGFFSQFPNIIDI